MNTTKTGTPAMSSNKPPPYKTIADTFNFTQLNRGIARHKAFENQQGSFTIPVDHPNDLVGIEIEVEGIQSPQTCEFYWNYKQDGSLRNHGAEYASIPLRVEQVETALIFLQKTIRNSIYNEPAFSPRTSAHVHVNVRDLSWEHLQNFVLLYAIFERHFFLQTTKERERGIFCVPLYRTDMLERLMPIENCSHNWYKYAAINLCTVTGAGDMKPFGTMEFRHMHGTWEPARLVPWINQIVVLKHAAKTFSNSEVLDLLRTMNTTSTYLGLYTKIFGKYAKTNEMQKADFEYCITMAKLALYGNRNCDTNSVSTFYQKYSRLITTRKRTVIQRKTTMPPPPPLPTYKLNTDNWDDQTVQQILNEIQATTPNLGQIVTPDYPGYITNTTNPLANKKKTTTNQTQTEGIF